MGLKQDIYLSRKPLAGFIAIGVAWACYFAQMPVIKTAVGASDGAYGAAVLFAAMGAVAAMWLAPLAQRLAGGLALSLGIAVVGAGMFAAGVAPGLGLLAAALLLASMGSGVVDVLINARVSEIEARTGRSLMNLNHALYSFAYAGGALSTGALRAADATPVQVFAGLALLLGLLAWWARDVSPHIDEDSGLGAATVPHGLVWMAGGVVLIAFVAEASAEGWSALHLERTLGGSAAEGALGPAMLGLTMGIGRLSGHALARLMRDTTLMLLAILVSALGIALAALAGSVAMALAGFALGGLGISVVAPLALALVGRMVPPAARLKAISRAAVLGYGAFFFGPPMMGLIAEGFGLRAAFLLIAALLVVTALALVPLLARRAAAASV
tara:strand:+ start:25847 stop:27001 length:1155 start_codon:yes stop_codon:yes gene_type:complete